MPHKPCAFGVSERAGEVNGVELNPANKHTHAHTHTKNRTSKNSKMLQNQEVYVCYSIPSTTFTQGLFELCVIRGYYVSHILMHNISHFCSVAIRMKSKSPWSDDARSEANRCSLIGTKMCAQTLSCKVDSVRLLPFVSAEYHNIPHSAPANRWQSQNIQSMQYASQIFFERRPNDITKSIEHCTMM